MNRQFLLIIISGLVLIGLIVAGYFVYQHYKPKSSNVTMPPEPSPALSTITTSPSASTAQTSQVKIFMILVGDAGKSGKKIGCDDSVIGVSRDITPTAAPLRAAYEELLSIKARDYGQSGMINALAESKLNIASISIDNTVATVKFTGTLAVAGTCQAPEIKAQLEETALQFSTVKSVNIFINNVPIDTVLSQKGE